MARICCPRYAIRLNAKFIGLLQRRSVCTTGDGERGSIIVRNSSGGIERKDYSRRRAEVLCEKDDTGAACQPSGDSDPCVV